MKKFLAILLSIMVTVSSASAYFGEEAEYQNVFSDMDTSTAFAESIFLLYDIGVLNGNEDGSFAPDRYLNRAELAKLLVTANYQGFDEDAAGCFEDLEAGGWYEGYVCSAKDFGFVQGDNGQGRFFRPSGTTNVAEALSTMNMLFDWGVETSEAEVWYEPLFETAYAKNVLADDFRADQLVTRAIFADILAKSIVLYDTGEEVFNSYESYYELIGVAIDKYELACSDYGYVDEETGECVFECEGAECEEIQAEIDAYATDLLAEFYSDERSFQEGSVAPENLLALFEINENDEIVWVSGDEYEEYYQIWERFRTLIPKEVRPDLKELAIFTDNTDNLLAYVEQTPTVIDQWRMAIDEVDALNGGVDNPEFSLTLIHEFAHLLTLNKSQILFDEEVYSGDISDQRYAEIVAECQPRYFTGEGCALGRSYINAFFEKFWAGSLFEENEALLYILDDEEYYQALDDFYYQHQDQFVTSYAATNPAEDIAESFTVFVIEDKPTGNSIADQKIEFFYGYPELVELRSIIRAGMVRN